MSLDLPKITSIIDFLEVSFHKNLYHTETSQQIGKAS